MEKDILPLVLYPDKRLTEVSVPIESVDDKAREHFDQLAAGMIYYEGCGLAGVQLGIMRKMFVVDYDHMLKYDKEIDPSRTPLGKPLYMANAEILEKSEDQYEFNDACLSLPGVSGLISRAARVKVKYLDYNNREQVIAVSGLLAFCIQHEEDHTNGKLLLSYFSPLKRRLAINRLEKVIRQIARNRKDKLYF